MASLNFTAGIFRNQTRIRLFFDDALADLAFQTPWFTVETPEYESPPIAVVAALAVIAAPNAVEIVLDRELIPGVVYRVNVRIGLPSETGSADALVLDLRTPGAPEPQRVTGSIVPDIFGEDIAWLSDDWREDADGDLAVVSGIPNVEGALTRRLASEGLIWARAYGLKARRYVDAPALGLGPLGSQATNQALLDDRVDKAEATADEDTVALTFQPVGYQQTQVVSVGR